MNVFRFFLVNNFWRPLPIGQIQCMWSFDFLFCYTDVVFRVWTHHPDIQTHTTIMSKSPLLSLEWAPKPDRLVR